MAIIRACSYTATIQTPEAPTEYSAILVTFAQDSTNIIQKTQDDVTIDNANIVVQLDQSETAQLECGKKCFLQVRCYKSQYEAPGSSIWAIDVRPALDDTILPTSSSESEVTP